MFSKGHHPESASLTPRFWQSLKVYGRGFIRKIWASRAASPFFSDLGVFREHLLGAALGRRLPFFPLCVSLTCFARVRENNEKPLAVHPGTSQRASSDTRDVQPTPTHRTNHHTGSSCMYGGAPSWSSSEQCVELPSAPPSTFCVCNSAEHQPATPPIPPHRTFCSCVLLVNGKTVG